jgi:hypothetical protein
MKLRSILIIALISCVLTAFTIITVEYLFLGYHKKPEIKLSVNSPDGNYSAYVEEAPSVDPPNQSLYIAKNGAKEFRLVDDLPEDIDMIKDIGWSPDSRTVVFATSWYLIITNVDNFNIMKVSLNDDWWKWHKEAGGTFISSNETVEIEKLRFINSDSIEVKTSHMSQSNFICVADL